MCFLWNLQNSRSWLKWLCLSSIISLLHYDTVPSNMLTLILPQVPDANHEMSGQQIWGHTLWILSLFFLQSFRNLFTPLEQSLHPTRTRLLCRWRWTPHMETTRPSVNLCKVTKVRSRVLEGLAKSGVLVNGHAWVVVAMIFQASGRWMTRRNFIKFLLIALWFLNSLEFILFEFGKRIPRSLSYRPCLSPSDAYVSMNRKNVTN